MPWQKKCMNNMSEKLDGDNIKQIILDNDKEVGICRDFLRGVCDRQHCKFRHEKSINNFEMNAPPTLNFCHDYQNNSCPRPNCRFIHCTPEEEEHYKKTGELPLHLQADAIRKHQLALQPPVCKNFMNGDCRRGNSCKYRHVTRAEHESEIHRTLKLAERDRFERSEPIENHMLPTIPEPRQCIKYVSGGNEAGGGLGRRNGSNYNSYQEFGLPKIKRRFFPHNKLEFIDNNSFEIADCDLDTRAIRMNNIFQNNQQTNAILTRIDPRILMLEEENNLLHKQVAELKKQVSDLTATNEFLLDQNAQLRVSSKRNAGNVTSVAVPAVTITNTTVPQNNVSAPPPQQMIRTVTASVATVPVSIATVTAGNPVSIGAVSMAPVQAVPAVSIAQPAAQQIIAQSQQLALANSTTQLAIQQNLATNLAQQTQSNIPLANQQLTSTAQQLALAASAPQQLLAQAQQNLASSQQMALTAQPSQINAAINTPQINAAINTSQAIAMSNASQPMVSYPIMTQSVLQNGLPH